MEPNRRAASSAEAGEPEAPPRYKFTAIKEALMAIGPQVRSTRNPDICSPLTRTNNPDIQLPGARVHRDYYCMLTQTNIRENKNKFYLIEVLVSKGSYYCWTRWARVGESGMNNLTDPSDADVAIQNFESLFKKKTNNSWSDRENFVSHPEKYTLIEVDEDQNAEVKGDTVDGEDVNVELDAETKRLIQFIFNNDMFKAMTMKLDIPLGIPSKHQIVKGFEAVEEIEAAIKNGEGQKLSDLTSKYFTIIPHNFGRQRPPVISDYSVLQSKEEMLLVLAGIKIAQSLKAEKAKEEMEDTVPHPVDQNYKSLKCNLALLDKKSKEFKIIEDYLKATGQQPSSIDVWVVDRETEVEGFKENDALENRKLLWYGTNEAMVAAILKCGLCIMPYSFGRVGSGIYFANNKSADVGPSYRFMFLNEVALGKEYTITENESNLRKPPDGYDSVVPRGQQESDPSKDVFIELDGKNVALPQYEGSHFSDYLICKESQCRIRFLLQLQFD